MTGGLLFLYRPRQTYMPYRLPRNMTAQRQYNSDMQERFSGTRRVSPAAPTAAPRDPVSALKDLAQLHDAGKLSDAEFASAKAKVLGQGG
jgi:hypothetical protein